MAMFNDGIGVDAPQPPPGVELPGQMAAMLSRLPGNQEFWLEHEMRQYPRAAPDLAAMTAAAARLIVAGGRDSREHFPYQASVALAGRLGSDVVQFPGDHVGYAKYPIEFAARLAEVLTPGATSDDGGTL
jgi:hypothetical protein